MKKGDLNQTTKPVVSTGPKIQRGYSINPTDRGSARSMVDSLLIITKLD